MCNAYFTPYKQHTLTAGQGTRKYNPSPHPNHFINSTEHIVDEGKLNRAIASTQVRKEDDETTSYPFP
jgi:hypothetical protein